MNMNQNRLANFSPYLLLSLIPLHLDFFFAPLRSLRLCVQIPPSLLRSARTRESDA